MLEQEYKRMLTKEQYDLIKANYRFDDEIIQTNFYYDTPDFRMIKNGFTVRVREINEEKLFLQIKKKLASKIDGVRVRSEFEKEIDNLPKEIDFLTVENLIRQTLKINFTKLEEIGFLITERSVLKTSNCEIALDKNTYLGKTDYELEIEFEDNHFEALQFLKKLGMDCGNTAMGKNKRFLKERLKTASR